ncbi:unnamed protein product, partial [Trichogramma brassicae]
MEKCVAAANASEHHPLYMHSARCVRRGGYPMFAAAVTHRCAGALLAFPTRVCIRRWGEKLWRAALPRDLYTSYTLSFMQALHPIHTRASRLVAVWIQSRCVCSVGALQAPRPRSEAKRPRHYGVPNAANTSRLLFVLFILRRRGRREKKNSLRAKRESDERLTYTTADEGLKWKKSKSGFLDIAKMFPCKASSRPYGPQIALLLEAFIYMCYIQHLCVHVFRAREREKGEEELYIYIVYATHNKQSDPNIPEVGEQAARALHPITEDECCFNICSEDKPGLGICANCTNRVVYMGPTHRDPATAPKCDMSSLPGPPPRPLSGLCGSGGIGSMMPSTDSPTTVNPSDIGSSPSSSSGSSSESPILSATTSSSSSLELSSSSPSSSSSSSSSDLPFSSSSSSTSVSVATYSSSSAASSTVAASQQLPLLCLFCLWGVLFSRQCSAVGRGLAALVLGLVRRALGQTGRTVRACLAAVLVALLPAAWIDRAYRNNNNNNNSSPVSQNHGRRQSRRPQSRLSCSSAYRYDHRHCCYRWWLWPSRWKSRGCCCSCESRWLWLWPCRWKRPLRFMPSKPRHNNNNNNNNNRQHRPQQPWRVRKKRRRRKIHRASCSERPPTSRFLVASYYVKQPSEKLCAQAMLRDVIDRNFVVESTEASERLHYVARFRHGARVNYIQYYGRYGAPVTAAVRPDTWMVYSNASHKAASSNTSTEQNIVILEVRHAGTRQLSIASSCRIATTMMNCSSTDINTVHEGRRDHACEKCEKKFGLKVNLLTHLKTVHENRKDYACNKVQFFELLVALEAQCSATAALVTSGQSTRSYPAQNIILRTRRTIKNFLRQCLRWFLRLNFYRLSLLILLPPKRTSTVHEGRRDHACEKCEKKFGLKVNLLTHLKIVHENRKDYACDKCEKKFGQKTHLTKHKKKFIVHMAKIREEMISEK